MSYQTIGREFWSVLSEMPFDIIVNYPFHGKKIEVHAREWIDEKDSFFSRLTLDLETEQDLSAGYHHPERGLYLGEDGLYYTDLLSMRNALKYYWPNDLKEVLQYFENELLRSGKFRKKLLQVSYTCSVNEFSQLLSPIEPDSTRILGDCNDNPELFHIPELPKDFLIVNHLTLMPRLVGADYKALILEMRFDGTSAVYERFQGRNHLGNILVKALRMRRRDRGFFCLVMDGKPPLRELNEFERVTCGIKVLWDCLEIFDEDDAREMFLLKLRK